MSENFDSLFEAAIGDASALSSGSFPRLDCEGLWKVKVIECSYGASQKGDTKRAMYKVEVIANLKDSVDKVTARTNLYVTAPADAALAQRNIAPYYNTLKALVGKEKLLDDAVDYDDIVQNIVAQSNKCLKLGKEIILTLQLRKNAKKEGEFYKNVFVFDPTHFVTETNTGSAPASAEKSEKDPFAEL